MASGEGRRDRGGRDPKRRVGANPSKTHGISQKRPRHQHRTGCPLLCSVKRTSFIIVYPPAAIHLHVTRSEWLFIVIQRSFFPMIFQIAVCVDRVWGVLDMEMETHQAIRTWLSDCWSIIGHDCSHKVRKAVVRPSGRRSLRRFFGAMGRP